MADSKIEVQSHSLQKIHSASVMKLNSPEARPAVWVLRKGDRVGFVPPWKEQNPPGHPYEARPRSPLSTCVQPMCVIRGGLSNAKRGCFGRTIIISVMFVFLSEEHKHN